MNVKPWVKAAGWLILGGGVGFFAGYQVGAWTSSKGPKNANEGYSYVDGEAERDDQGWEPVPVEVEVRKTLDEYAGVESESGSGSDSSTAMDGDIDGDELLADQNLSERLKIETVPADIPQAHPQHFVPVAITEEEWNDNPDELDKVDLLFYEYDEVLYRPDCKDIVVDPDELLGFGATFRFYSNPPTETVYIQNETMGEMYRMKLVHAAYHDEPPVEEDGEELYDHPEDEDEDENEEEVYYGD